MATVPLLLAEEDVENGGKSDDSSNIQNDFAYRNNVHNAHIKIRMAFLRKVYGLISVQLLLTVVISAVFILCEPVKQCVQQNSWMMGVSFFATFGILIALHFKRREHPTNLILLGAFTIILSYSVGTVVTFFDVSLVLQAMFITMAIVIGLTVYTFQSKRDFSFLGFGLFAGLSALLIGGIMQLFLQSPILERLTTIGGAILFALFIIYDTHMLMHILSPEEYILAAINIYLDIINLFLHILQALAAAKR
ncbi:protein lifeguard 4 [Fopius arisanus]|uniref:Protein lifeguard 4 n=1 Tax=Fopius arisanus TaxID=64838 RepID=A0A0C9QSS9_9HYME|nr:PREDICTED: protein lifeguard 4-like [Fopius arisanus]